MPQVPADVSGLYQYIIGGLLSAVSILGGVVTIQWRQANDVNKARLTERDILNKTVSDTVVAIKELTAISQRRSEVNEKIGDLINQITVALKLLTERLDVQHQHSNKDLAAAIDAVKVLAASVQQLNTNLMTGVAEIKGEIGKVK